MKENIVVDSFFFFPSYIIVFVAVFGSKLCWMIIHLFVIEYVE